jgi:protoporphyrinogen oxidase
LSTDRSAKPHVGIIGGGFCGLAAAYELGRRGVRATVFERDPEVGGLAGSFRVGGSAWRSSTTTGSIAIGMYWS